MKKTTLCLLALISFVVLSCQHDQSHLLPGVKVLTNQVGYDSASYKQAVISADSTLDFTSFDLLNVKNDSVVFQGKVAFKGGVDQWNHWKFWTIDFSDFTTPGNYFIRVNAKNGIAYSLPFRIAKDVLERYTLSNVIYYFKGQR
ncbi:MAG: cellulase N-terminal Ig-like domain-containing protein, partial [Chitinophagaceae bacterium]